MEPEARYTVIGAALVVLVLAAATAIIWLARTGAAEDFHFYTIYFEHQSLEGLQIGGDVTMRGVQVGRVESYALDPDNINRVKVLVRVDRRTPVSNNTVAIVSRNIVTGLARVSLVTPDKPGPALTAPPAGEAYPVIAEGRSGLEQLTDAANHLASVGSATLENLNALLTSENRAAFATTLANLRDLTGALAQRVDRIDETTATFNRAAAEVARASRDIATTVARVQSDLAPVSAQAQATLRDVSEAVGRLERDASALARRVDQAADVGTLDIRATTRELRESAASLARTADRLRDPRAALVGPSPAQLGPGEKLP